MAGLLRGRTDHGTRATPESRRIVLHGISLPIAAVGTCPILVGFLVAGGIGGVLWFVAPIIGAVVAVGLYRWLHYYLASREQQLVDHLGLQLLDDGGGPTHGGGMGDSEREPRDDSAAAEAKAWTGRSVIVVVVLIFSAFFWGLLLTAANSLTVVGLVFLVIGNIFLLALAASVGPHPPPPEVD